MNELAKRVVVAAIGIPLALWLIFLGGWAITVPLALIAGLGAREFFLLGVARDIEPFQWLGVPGAAGLVALAGLSGSFSESAPWMIGLLLGVFLLSAASSIWYRGPGRSPLSAVSLTVAGIIYVGGSLSFGLFLRNLPEVHGGFSTGLSFQGPLLLVFPLTITWAGDSAAYFFGHWLGNRKLIPSVSPGKTVAGGVAGLVTTVVIGCCFGWLAVGFSANPLTSALIGACIGLVLGIAAQVGDLVESVLKREAGVKDSSSLLPGHGGILDRFDAVFFTLPLTYFMVRLVEFLQ